MTLFRKTARLVLRELAETDVEAVHGFRGDPEVMRFSVSGPETREQILARYIPACLTRYSRDGFGQWAVVRKSDGAVIGECGICVQEIGMSLRKRASFHGIAVLVHGCQR